MSSDAVSAEDLESKMFPVQPGNGIKRAVSKAAPPSKPGLGGGGVGAKTFGAVLKNVPPNSTMADVVLFLQDVASVCVACSLFLFALSFETQRGEQSSYMFLYFSCV